MAMVIMSMFFSTCLDSSWSKSQIVRRRREKDEVLGWWTILPSGVWKKTETRVSKEMVTKVARISVFIFQKCKFLYYMKYLKSRQQMLSMAVSSLCFSCKSDFTVTCNPFHKNQHSQFILYDLLKRVQKFCYIETLRGQNM